MVDIVISWFFIGMKSPKNVYDILFGVTEEIITIDSKALISAERDFNFEGLKEFDDAGGLVGFFNLHCT